MAEPHNSTPESSGAGRDGSPPSSDHSETAPPAPPSRIGRFVGQYRFLSNFFPCRVIDERGREHTSVEHAYQCSKATTDADRERIAAAKHPSKAKRLGQRLTPDGTWSQRKDEVMRRLLLQKFAPGTPLAERLVATSPAELAEGNSWGDKYWGVCDGVGENRLGNLLMEIRAMLLHNRSTDHPDSHPNRL